MSGIYCGKCNSGDREEDMKDGTELKEVKDIYHANGTTKILRCPKCFNEVKVCIPDNSPFWNMLRDAFCENTTEGEGI